MGVEVKKCFVATCDKCGREEIYYSEDELNNNEEFRTVINGGTMRYLCNDCADRLELIIKRFLSGKEDGMIFTSKDEYMKRLKLEKDASYAAGINAGKIEGEKAVWNMLKKKYGLGVAYRGDRIMLSVSDEFKDNYNCWWGGIDGPGIESSCAFTVAIEKKKQ